jgi:two-component system, NarL family, response regulator DesR
MFELSQDTATTVRATRPSPLTGQEQAVLRQLATGKVYKEIGAALGIASSTVRSHCQSIYRKLDVIDRANAVLTAAEQGWI